MTSVYVFPGQGSQKVGMGKEIHDAFPEARLVFEEIDDVLNQNLSKIIFSGSESDLNLTYNTQPALMAVSLAIFRVMEKALGDRIESIHSFAGHSLGEYSALAAAGVLSIADTAKLLRIRGKAMQDAVPIGEGAMAAILGMPQNELEDVLTASRRGQTCSIANDNCAGQLVISGHLEAVERAMQLADKQGARKCIMLPVSAPFHCSLMAPAAVKMAEALNEVTFSSPLKPILTNVTADFEQDTTKIRHNLVEQVTGQVRWRESIEKLIDVGVTQLVEVGAGRVLTGLNKRIIPDALAISIQTPHDLDTFFQS
ncbi:MAG: ACP S-malonyltransferase [Alphaproteobacteria bacterium]|nr:ACP S-malonyltransferase [Alphaproteobacteria bacterium]